MRGNIMVYREVVCRISSVISCVRCSARSKHVFSTSGPMLLPPFLYTRYTCPVVSITMVIVSLLRVSSVSFGSDSNACG